MFHAPFSSKAFLFFDCEKLGGALLLKADLSIECYKSKWNAFLPFANSTVGLCCWYTAGARVLYAQLSSWSTIPCNTPFFGFHNGEV